MSIIGLEQYIYQRDGFTVVCDQNKKGAWIGTMTLDDGQVIEDKQEYRTHNAAFSAAIIRYGRMKNERNQFGMV